jgi:hypothetical protein
MAMFGCSYSLRTNQYPYLKTLRILPVENKTTESDLDIDIFEYLSDSFQRDGRLLLVTDGPDVLLECSLIFYEEIIYSSDSANNVEDYQVKMNFSVKMTDLVNDKVLYENKNLAIAKRYAVNNAVTSADYDNRIDAETGIYEDLFTKIIQNTLEDW